ncbi:MAG: formylglycine-generating enzyme family protein, partial [Gemmataceae bacterium]|nr:formylglycine-generating enzyme family protein [Gemmataceae bacterium]
PSHFKGPNRPVENVSWDDCQEFCARLSEHAGCRVALPTEAEWEYACRAGTTTHFHFGDVITTDLANHYGKASWNSPTGVYRAQTTDVGTFPANPWGLHDMHGNVWEWCADVYKPYAGGESNENSNNNLRVLRGGSWSGDPVGCRAAFRDWNAPAYRYYSYGFRVCFRLD